jgi:hypothetical protein
VLLAPDYAALAFHMLLAEITREIPYHLGLDMKAVRQNSPVWAALEECPQEYIKHIGLRSLYSRLDVSGNVDIYLSSLGKLRRNLKSARKKLEKLGRVSVEIRQPTASEHFLRNYMDLDASGWKGRNGTAIRDNPAVVAFYENLISNLSTEGRWEWQILRIGKRVIAAGMGVRCGKSLILPKYAFDEDFAFCSPGNLLTEEVFKDAFKRVGINEVNHMSFSDSDRSWRMSQDVYTDVHLVRRSAMAVLFHLPRIASRSLYQAYVRPHIPTFMKELHRNFKRRGGRKPRRATETQSARQESG